LQPTPAAGCKPEPARVEMPAFGAMAEAAEHADIDANYEFRCANPAALKSVETTIFKSFKRLYRLEASAPAPAARAQRG
jgi:hypothetical protein